MSELPPAAFAFDSIADIYDSRFTPWLSVAAQRRAVRRALLKAFPIGAELLEVGGGTGDDALWLAKRTRRVLMTDASPAMVRVASDKFGGHPDVQAELSAAETMEALAERREAAGSAPFDGAYSVFASLNCVTDLTPFARGMSRLLRPGAPMLLVVFGTACPGEVIVEGIRRRPGNMFRRRERGDVPARLSGRHFTVRYHREQDLRRAFAPWFDPAGKQGIGVFVPPSAAEPWISGYPRFVSLLERLDRGLSTPLAALGDHILYRFVRR